MLKQYLTSNVNDHPITLGTLISGGDWQHFEGSFTVSTGYLGYEECGRKYRPTISFYANPTTIGADGTTADKVGVEYMFDNFKIYSSKPAHFE